MFGVEINYKNGKKDWVDPVESEPVEKDGVLIVTNNFYSYEYSMVNIEKWFKYELCKTCNYDLRTYDCSENDCLNPRHSNDQ